MQTLGSVCEGSRGAVTPQKLSNYDTRCSPARAPKSVSREGSRTGHAEKSLLLLPKPSGYRRGTNGGWRSPQCPIRPTGGRARGHPGQQSSGAGQVLSTTQMDDGMQRKMLCKQNMRHEEGRRYPSAKSCRQLRPLRGEPSSALHLP